MGEFKHDGLAVPGRVVLAHEPAFTIGKLRVDPATRQVVSGASSETLEPRVMQVLVALARANGAIVTRDELIEWCWDGRIVTDDAINRVLSRIRQIAAGLADSSFRLETIPRVGYRLITGPEPKSRIESGAHADAAAASQSTRRAALAALASAVAIAGTGALLWQRPWRHRPDAPARELFLRGDAAQKTGLPSQTRQAASYFEQAVRLDPRYADAWGALALAYTHSLDGFSEAELASMPGRIRSAASRALELDPDNADAQLALACMKPYFRNWAESEAALRKLVGRFPNNWLCNGRLALLLYQVGRFDEGVAFHRRVISLEPMIAGPYAFAATALSDRGRIEEADAMLKEALDRWPAHPMIWDARFNFLVFNGRPEAATAFVLDPDSRPSEVPKEEVDLRLRLAKALKTGQPRDIDASVEDFRRMALSDVTAIPYAVKIFALFGRVGLIFEALERYYFNRGPFGASSPIGPYTRRQSDMLFSGTMAAARSDPRFPDLLKRLGLEDYWRATGTVPDFRRTA